MVQNHPRITLEQWRALIAVIDQGSYALAALSMHKTQSSISYAVRRIEEQLGVTLFEIVGRKAELTDAGSLLARRGRELVERASGLERAATHLGAGWEAELRLTVEILYPTWLLLESIEQFCTECPQTRVELYESVLGGTDEALLERRVDLAVTSHIPPGFHGVPLMQVKLFPVVAPTHPLNQLGRPATHADLSQHRQVLIRDSGSARTRNAGWQGSEQRLTVSNKATAIHALCMGLGFAWQAEHAVRFELQRGSLVPLQLNEDPARFGWLHLVQTDGDLAGPAARLMSDLLRLASKRMTVDPTQTDTDWAQPD